MSNAHTLANIIDMASGKQPAEILIINGKIIDVFNQTIIEKPLALGLGKIVGWGDYEAKQIIDAKGGYILPGLIDGHVHIESSTLTPKEFANIILPHGTTTIIADPHEIANVCGIKGIEYMLQAAQSLPLTIKIMLPTCVPATPFEHAGATLNADDLAMFVNHPNVGGLGEMMDYPGIINHSEDMLNKLLLGHKHQCVMDGHSPGLTGKALTAYFASGISTDHECSSLADFQERLSQGVYILLREGSTCCDLLNLLPAVTPANSRRCVMCTDDRDPADILSSGHINKSLRLAIEAGIPPVQAITMATLNSAECYKLKHKGAIAPGYDADLVIMDNLTQFNAQMVFTNGQCVAKNGHMLLELPQTPYADVTDTINLPPLNAKHLTLPLSSSTIRTIFTTPGSVVTKTHIKEIVVDQNNCFDAKLNAGLNKIAVIERHHASGEIGLGVIENYELTEGAIAVSVAHDSHNIVVVGDNDNDMLLAVNTLAQIKGGIVLVQHGEVLAMLPLPIAGLMSDQPAHLVAEKTEELHEIMRNQLHIIQNPQPLMTLVFMTLPVIPDIKLTTKGLFDVSAFDYVDLCI